MSDARKVLVVCADGSEDIELASITDTLRRAKLDVTLATVNATLRTTLARGLKIEADALLSDVSEREFAAIVLPGGLPGATHLAASATLKAMLAAQSQSGRVVAAVCASPVVVLNAHGLIGQRKAVAYPSFVAQLSNAQANERVVVDGSLITSAGPGTSIEFALAIVEYLVDKATATTLAEQMLVKQ
jgi:4-methyl-5(b-hydroxyethyl)-thiazole monophosphate biosynthesis